MSELTRMFLEETKGRGDLPEQGVVLERLLEQTVGNSCRERPFALETRLFVRYLAQRLPPARAEVSLAQVLNGMHLADLYLACACVHQVPEALTTLEHDHLAELRTWLKRTDSVTDEVCQSVRIQLLVGLSSTAGPQLVKYLGHGSLRHWLHVIASHLAPPRQSPALQGPPEEHLLQVLEAVPAPGPGAELELINQRHALETRQALKDAIAALTKEQRRLLRFRYVDQLSTTQIGILISKDQSTASRKIKLAQDAVHEETRRLLRERLQLTSQEFESLLLAIQSGLDVSLSQLLGSSDTSDTEG